ncbi:MAG: alpha/beta hydrolase [Pseudomonadota bacterium]
MMKRQMMILVGGMAGILITTPIFAPSHAQRSGSRPSRECVQEIVALCGTDRSQIRACLQSRSSELSSECQSEVSARVRERQTTDQSSGQQGTGAFQRSSKPTRTIVFGNETRQQVDIYEPEGAVDELPLVLFVHGGGWSRGSHDMVDAKPQHFGAQEIYFASTGYRLVPDASVEDQAADIGAAIQALIGQAGAIGFDRERIVLIGHSAGAHLAALVATNPEYSGEAFGSIKGVVLLDGAGYDVAAHMAQGYIPTRGRYEAAFGLDVERQKALSAITHVGDEDAPNWLALYVAERPSAKKQAENLAMKLSEAGASATAVAISNTDHGRMNREIGTEAGAAQTQAMDAFLAQVFGG